MSSGSEKPPYWLDEAAKARAAEQETAVPTPSIAELLQPLPNVTPPAALHGDKPGTKTLDYIGLGLLLAPPTVVVEMYLRGENTNWKRAAIATAISWTAGSLVVLASHGWQSWRTRNTRLLPRLIALENRFWAKAVIVGTFMAFALALSTFLSENSAPPIAIGFTQAQVDEKVTSALAPIQEKLKIATRQRDDALAESDALKKQIENPPNSPKTPLPHPNPVEFRRLSREQTSVLVAEFSDAIKEVPKVFLSKADDVHGEANQYMSDFIEVFDRSGTAYQRTPQKPSGPKQTGIMISVRDPENPSSAAKKTQAILRDAGIVAPIVPLPPELNNLPAEFTVFIGPNPL